MRIDLDCHDSLLVCFVFRVLIDFASELIGLFAVQAPRFTSTPVLDFSQPLKEQHTARIPGTHTGNLARHLVSCILVHTADVQPKILIAVFPFDRFP